MLTNRQMDKKHTNERTELHQFRKQPSYDGDLCPCQVEFDWTNRFRVRVRKQKCGWTDGWTNGQKTDKRTDGITPISKGT